jgi:hypothetical protein
VNITLSSAASLPWQTLILAAEGPSVASTVGLSGLPRAFVPSPALASHAGAPSVGLILAPAFRDPPPPVLQASLGEDLTLVLGAGLFIGAVFRLFGRSRPPDDGADRGKTERQALPSALKCEKRIEESIDPWERQFHFVALLRLIPDLAEKERPRFLDLISREILREWNVLVDGPVENEWSLLRRLVAPYVPGISTGDRRWHVDREENPDNACDEIRIALLRISRKDRDVIKQTLIKHFPDTDLDVRVNARTAFTWIGDIWEKLN